MRLSAASRPWIARHAQVDQRNVDALASAARVLLIALLALARKFIVLDLASTAPLELLALGTVTLALGVTYWLMRERDDKLRPRP